MVRIVRDWLFEVEDGFGWVRPFLVVIHVWIDSRPARDHETEGFVPFNVFEQESTFRYWLNGKLLACPELVKPQYFHGFYKLGDFEGSEHFLFFQAEGVGTCLI